MKEIKCPNCGRTFEMEESDYNQIAKQVRDNEFKSAIAAQKATYEKDKELAVKELEATKNAEISNLRQTLQTEKNKTDTLILEKDSQIKQLQQEITLTKANNELETKNAVQEKEQRILELNSTLKLKEQTWELKIKSINEERQKAETLYQEQIDALKNFKLKLSTKAVGESLEQYCENQFDILRASAFPNAYFEKDNDASKGSKGDFIFREVTNDGIEVLSIMFEMKNEMSGTDKKKHNADFFEKLDKDRKTKKCEYAVLVSMLEADSDYYNTGIVDVSFKSGYPKMYVIRPQFFIPIITLLRNEARRSLDLKRQFELAQRQNIDITNFEGELNTFIDRIHNNYTSAQTQFSKSIKDIDKAIESLQKVKDAFLSVEKKLEKADSCAQKLSIRALTKNNPTMIAKFAELENGK